jgi:oligoendopeptidase F
MRKMIGSSGRPLSLALALIALTITAGAQSRDRAQTPDKYTWNLSEIYPSDAAWRAAKDTLAAELPALR